MKKILISLLTVFSTSIGFGFDQPPTINVSKPSGGTTYTLCTSGCDFATLEDADSNMGPGDILQIKAGTYAAVSWNEAVGTAGNEVVVEAFGDGDVYIEGESRLGADYTIFDGGPNRSIIFRRAGTGGERPIRLQGSNVTLWRIKVEGPTGVCSNTNNTGLLCKGYPTITMDNPKIYNCLFENCSHKGVYISAARNGEIRNNIITGTGNTGLQVNPHEAGAEVDGLIISGNIFYNNGNCSGLPGHNLYMQSTTNGLGLKGVVVSNNFFWDLARSGLQISSIGTGMLTGEIEIYNNTFYNNVNYGIAFDSTVPDNLVSVSNNIMFNNGSGATSYGSTVLKANNSNLTTDPSFASTTETDSNYLKLSASSTNAIDQGVDLTLSGITNDFFGNTRSSGTFDIGAHEYASAVPDTTPPAAPTGLTIQ